MRQGLAEPISAEVYVHSDKKIMNFYTFVQITTKLYNKSLHNSSMFTMTTITYIDVYTNNFLHTLMSTLTTITYIGYKHWCLQHCLDMFQPIRLVNSSQIREHCWHLHIADCKYKISTLARQNISSLYSFARVGTCSKKSNIKMATNQKTNHYNFTQKNTNVSQENENFNSQESQITNHIDFLKEFWMRNF